MDDDGFISIQGRLKRFAKVAGEMVSLTLVEQLANAAWPDAAHAAIAVADAGKGEKIILLTEQKHAERSILAEQARRDGVAEICLPRQILNVAQIPVLGSGKIDYQAAQQLAEAMS